MFRLTVTGTGHIVAGFSVVDAFGTFDVWRDVPEIAGGEGRHKWTLKRKLFRTKVCWDKSNCQSFKHEVMWVRATSVQLIRITD